MRRLEWMITFISLRMIFRILKGGVVFLKFYTDMENGCNYLYFNADFLKQKERNWNLD